VANPMPSERQFRAARALLGWFQSDIAKAAGLSEPTVKRLEMDAAQVSSETRRKAQEAYEAAGVVFSDVSHGLKLRPKGKRGPGEQDDE
jgi:DNA-binding XRE family transcriptional regulator